MALGGKPATRRGKLHLLLLGATANIKLNRKGRRERGGHAGGHPATQEDGTVSASPKSNLFKRDTDLLNKKEQSDGTSPCQAESLQVDAHGSLFSLVEENFKMNIFLFLVVVVATCVTAVTSNCDALRECSVKVNMDTWALTKNQKCDLPQALDTRCAKNVSCLSIRAGCTDQRHLKTAEIAKAQLQFLCQPMVKNLLKTAKSRCHKYPKLVLYARANSHACMTEGVYMMTQNMTIEKKCELVKWTVDCSTQYMKNACGRVYASIAHALWRIYIHIQYKFCMDEGYIPIERVIY
ncbi:hypothetical protein PoB_003943400 [Plakobranchus ocellatus]|uniref:Uncharacterized protein n=1 Tax=Plakobranchus ocellatus TaxID=259542 RepID=A0AAV4B3J9_9GAST|nr:hypothetical protein PoB_003943400 [Plakobranchus ocellatus]